MASLHSGSLRPFEREPDAGDARFPAPRMRIHRPTARGAFLLSLCLALSLAVVSAARAVNDPDDPPGNGKKQIIFPVVGTAKYFDDWGDPRGQGRHAGNDILTTWRSPAVAAEDADTVPTELEPVTTKRSDPPASVLWMTYVGAAALSILEHDVPFAAHRCQRTA